MILGYMPTTNWAMDFGIDKLTGPTLRIFGPRLHTHIANLLFAGMFSLLYFSMLWTRMVPSPPFCVCRTSQIWPNEPLPMGLSLV